MFTQGQGPQGPATTFTTTAITTRCVEGPCCDFLSGELSSFHYFSIKSIVDSEMLGLSSFAQAEESSSEKSPSYMVNARLDRGDGREMHFIDL